MRLAVSWNAKAWSSIKAADRQAGRPGGSRENHAAIGPGRFRLIIEQRHLVRSGLLLVADRLDLPTDARGDLVLSVDQGADADFPIRNQVRHHGGDPGQHLGLGYVGQQRPALRVGHRLTGFREPDMSREVCKADRRVDPAIPT